jgi:hypothetical protein
VSTSTTVVPTDSAAPVPVPVVATRQAFGEFATQYRAYFARTVIEADVTNPPDVDDVVNTTLAAVIRRLSNTDGTWRSFDQPALLVYMGLAVHRAAGEFLRRTRLDDISMATLAVDRKGSAKHNGRLLPTASPYGSLFGISQKKADERRDLAEDVKRARTYLTPEQDEMAEMIMCDYSVPEIARKQGMKRYLAAWETRRAKAPAAPLV